MSPRVVFVALLLATLPLVGLGDTSSADNPNTSFETESNNQTEDSNRNSSDIKQLKRKLSEKPKDEWRSYVDLINSAVISNGKNPSPDD